MVAQFWQRLYILGWVTYVMKSQGDKKVVKRGGRSVPISSALSRLPLGKADWKSRINCFLHSCQAGSKLSTLCPKSSVVGRLCHMHIVVGSNPVFVFYFYRDSSENWEEYWKVFETHFRKVSDIWRVNDESKDVS